LCEVAKTKIYDIAGSGLDSIDCAKIAKAYKVITEASKESDKNNAISKAYKLNS